MKKNLILSLVKSYPLKEFRPFVDTLRKTDFDGEIIFFANDLSKEAIKYFKKNKIKLIPFSMNYPYLRDNKIILNQLKEFKNVKLNIFHLREFLPLLFLMENKNKYDKVMLADSGDVIFQRDPFKDEIDNKKIYFPLQDNKIKESPKDSEWIETIYGDKYLKKIWDNNISCTGTIIGGIAPMINYLKFLSQEFEKGLTIDQGNHNVLVYSGKLKNQVLLKNQEGIFLTCSESNRKNFILDKNKKIRAKNGKVFSAVHQYDTFPEWSFLHRGICKRSIREFVKRFPLIGIALVKIKALFVKSKTHIKKE